MKLYSIAEVKRLHPDLQDLPYLTEIAKWIETFLAKPHAELGRTGSVCPFVPRSLKLNTIWLAVIRTQDCDPEDIEATVNRCRELFLQLEPHNGEFALHKAIMLIFPDVADRQVPAMIDAVQQKLKPHFVEKGLMLGEFYPHNESPGLHNLHFRPLRSPIPMLAIRFMVESDLPFLNRLHDAPDLRISYLSSYLDRLDGTIRDTTKLFSARSALAFAQTQLEPANSELAEPEPAPARSKCPFVALVKPLLQIKKRFAKV